MGVSRTLERKDGTGQGIGGQVGSKQQSYAAV